jgi:hypothetical protein
MVNGLDIDLDIAVRVEYKVDDPWPDGKHHPITIKSVNFRGEDISRLLHIGHVLTLQRRIHNRLIDSGQITDDHQAYPFGVDYGH